MSDALTPDAPNEGAAVQEAPAPEVEVESGSAGEAPPNVVPADRFNGLMSKYQSEKSEWDQRFSAMEAELNSLRAKDQETQEVPNEDVAELKAQVAGLTELLLNERSEAAREKVLDKYPDAKPFADLIVGGTPEEMEQVASALHDRMQLLKGKLPATETTDTETTETAPAGEVEGAPVVEAPEHSGAVTATGQETLVEAKNQAIANRDFEGFLAAASALQEASMAQVS